MGVLAKITPTVPINLAKNTPTVPLNLAKVTPTVPLNSEMSFYPALSFHYKVTQKEL